MATPIETLPKATMRVVPAPQIRRKAVGGAAPVMLPWLRAQSINVTRHAAALRPFLPDEFGTGAEAPTAGHIQAVNKLITGLRIGLLQMSGRVRKAAVATTRELSTERLQDLMRKKEHAHKVGAWNRKDMGLLLRDFRTTADSLGEMAAELRPNRARLLPRELSGAGGSPSDSGATAVLVHGDGIRAGNVSKRNSAEAAGETTQSFSADSASRHALDDLSDQLTQLFKLGQQIGMQIPESLELELEGLEAKETKE